jgi:hypothetical protein
MDEVVRALKGAGIADRDIQTSALSLQPQYSNPEHEAQLRARMAREPYIPPAQPQAPRIIGYEARNQVQVRVRKLGEMGRIIDLLVSAGANQVDGPSCWTSQRLLLMRRARKPCKKLVRERSYMPELPGSGYRGSSPSRKAADIIRCNRLSLWGAQPGRRQRLLLHQALLHPAN